MMSVSELKKVTGGAGERLADGPPGPVHPSGSLLDRLQCPQCAKRLAGGGGELVCTACGTTFPRTASGLPDLRLQRDKPGLHAYEVGPFERPVHSLPPLSAVPARATVGSADGKLPPRMSEELLSWFPIPSAAGAATLDLGCGQGLHREIIERLGYRWIGIDFAVEGGDLLADGQALPLRDDQFEFVLSISMLQYVPNPWAVIAEVHRVLVPGGTFIGTVPFLEPFSGGFFHMSHAGIRSLLEQGGFDVVQIAPSDSWTVLRAQASMGLFPMMPRRIANALVAPLELLHRLWWRMGALVNAQADERTRVTKTTGSFTFIARARI